MDPRITPDMVIMARERSRAFLKIVNGAAKLFFGPNFNSIVVLVDESQAETSMAIVGDLENDASIANYLTAALQRVTSPLPGQVVDASEPDGTKH